MDSVELLSNVQRAHGLRARAQALSKEEAALLQRAQEVGTRAGVHAVNPARGLLHVDRDDGCCCR
jgi:hypothetical protein